MNIIDFITANAPRLNLDVNSDEFKAFVSDPALAAREIPQSFVDAVSTKLMTESEAKINVGLKKYFTAMSLNPVDTTIKELADEYGLDDETKAVLLGDPNTYNRVRTFTKTLAELKDKASSATGSDKKVLADKIKELQDALNAEKANAARQAEEINNKWVSTLTAKELEGLFNGYEYAMPNIPKEVQAMTARNLFEQELRNKGGKYKYVDGQITLVSSESEDLPFSLDNKQVNAKQFADMVVAPMLKKHDAGTPAQAPTPTPAPINRAASNTKSAALKALEDLKAGSTVVY